MAFIPLSLRCGRYTIADLSPIISAIGLFTVLFLFTYDHLDREITGTGGYLGSITVPRPLSRFDTHPQAKLKTFETKMAAITQSARFQRSYGKSGELSIVQLPMPIPTSFLVSGAVAQKFCLECRTHSLNGKQCINTQNIYSARIFCEELMADISEGFINLGLRPYGG